MDEAIREAGHMKGDKALNIGLENWIIAGRVVAIVNANSAPIRRMIKQAREGNVLIDGTSGKTTRSVIVADSKHVILSSISPRNLSARLEKMVLG
jgi:regulator of extracellular matrix RemA (YlzA/DUF370 family)